MKSLDNILINVPTPVGGSDGKTKVEESTNVSEDNMKKGYRKPKKGKSNKKNSKNTKWGY